MRWRWCCGDVRLTYAGAGWRGRARLARVPAGGGGGAGVGGGGCAWTAVGGAGDGAAGGVAGGGGVPAAGSGVPGGAAGVHAGRCAARRWWLATAAALAAGCRPGGCRWCELDDPGRWRRWPGGGAGDGRGGPAAGRAGVRDLHVGVDGDAEGGGGDARGAGELLAAWAAAAYGVGPGCGCRCIASLAFDADGARACWCRWSAGGTLVVAGAGRRTEALAGLARAAGRAVVPVKVVPSHLAVLAGAAGGRAAGAGGGWWWAGRRCRARLVRRWLGGAGRGGGQRVRADRGDGVVRRAWRRRAAGRSARRSGGRWRIPGCSCWMSGWARCRPGWPGSCTWPGRSWRGGTWGGRG